MSAIKILALDNSPLFLQGLLACLRQFPMVAKADACRSFEQLLEKLVAEQPQIVFVELSQTGENENELSFCRQLTSSYKSIFIAAISKYNTQVLIKEAYASGVRAFFDKSIDVNVLQHFLNAYCQNKITGCYTAVPRITMPADICEIEQNEVLDLLTRRERQVMKLIVHGYTHVEIAKELNVGYETYKSHRSRILQKLSLKNTVELTHLAISHQLYEAELPEMQKKLAGR